MKGRTWAVRIDIRLPRKYVERSEEEGRDDCIMRIFMLRTPHGILLERSNQEREHLENLGVD